MAAGVPIELQPSPGEASNCSGIFCNIPDASASLRPPPLEKRATHYRRCRYGKGIGPDFGGVEARFPTSFDNSHNFCNISAMKNTS